MPAGHCKGTRIAHAARCLRGGNAMAAWTRPFNVKRDGKATYPDFCMEPTPFSHHRRRQVLDDPHAGMGRVREGRNDKFERDRSDQKSADGDHGPSIPSRHHTVNPHYRNVGGSDLTPPESLARVPRVIPAVRRGNADHQDQSGGARYDCVLQLQTLSTLSRYAPPASASSAFVWWWTYRIVVLMSRWPA